MESTNWLRQTPDKPLFPDVLWSRPENKRLAGKLSIIGGHRQSFGAVSEAYSAALKAGIGSARVVLPDKLRKMLAEVFPEAEYAPSTLIGSFSRQALDKLMEEAEWADAVLLAGDFGRNSETAVLLESFLDKFGGLVTMAGDSIDYFLGSKYKLLGRHNTVITAGIDKVQKLAQPDFVIRQQDDLAQLVNKLSNLTGVVESVLLTFHSGSILVAAHGSVSTMPAKEVKETELAAAAATWWLQQPEKPFEALTSAAYFYALNY